ncbi:MAG: NUDIX domain-containing protein [Ruminococcaceae bacterium]|jgi:isopentenyldiphosphate isomerase|nr:NUDIX domain-containing protein [Oscillospiraceae bacterium]
MELFDLCDDTGTPTGETVERRVAHREGICHRTAHIWVVRPGPGGPEVLLQKRSRDKDSFPGLYDTSAAGHVRAGDEPLPSAARELAEELGITAAPEELDFAGTFHIHYEKVFHGEIFRDNEVAFVYVYRGAVDTASLTLQAEEVERVDWFDLQEVCRLCRPPRDPRFCVPLPGLETLTAYLARHHSL